MAGDGGSTGSAEPLTAIAVGLIARDLGAGRRLTAALGAAGLEVAMEAEDAASLVARLSGRQLGAVVVVLGSGAGSAVEIRSLRRQLRSVPIVALVPSTDEAQCRRAISAGADGAVLERDLDQALATTVAAAAAGQVSFPQSLQGDAETPSLTPRERQVLGMAVTGLTNALIARELGLAESTVKSHLSAAFAKLGVASRAEAAALIMDPVGARNLEALAADSEASE